MFKSWQFYFSDLIKGKRKGFFADFLRDILHFMSWGFQSIVYLKNLAFDHGFLRQYHPPVPLVISVGNIVAGGTGKTPVTLMLAKEFYPNTHLAILSRGYKSQAEKNGSPTILSEGNGPLYPASYCGDEPVLLAENLPKAIIIVGKNRQKSSQLAAKAGVNLILLDDGMQHRKLARDLEVIVLNSSDLFGQGYFLPRGFLRESPKSLSKADLIILNHLQNHNQFVSLKQELAQFTTAPIVGTQLVVSEIVSLAGKMIDSIQGKRVGIFCGIAHPENFQKTLQDLGAIVVTYHFFPDHQGFEKNDLINFVKSCKELGAELILCTEKDKVKLPSLPETSPPIAWIKSELKIIEGKDNWISFIEKAKKILSK